MFRFRARLLTNEQTSEIVAAKLKWILSGCTPDKVILFGSAARGEMTDQSDVDLAVIFRKPEDVKRQKKALFETAGRDFWPQDLLFLSDREFAERAQAGGVCEIIATEGKVLFERKVE